MACSNQIRDKADAPAFGEKTTTPGGHAITFYSSVRLKLKKPKKIWKKRTINGKEIKRCVGIETEVEVYKNSEDVPHRSAPIYIIFNYGIDDIRSNLDYLKRFKYKGKGYYHKEEKIGNSIDEAIKTVEERNLEKDLQEEVQELWRKIEKKMTVRRKKKVR